MLITLGGHSITFNPGRNGTDENANGSFHVENFSKNSSEYGVVYGGRLKFTLAFSGKVWRDELIAAGLETQSAHAQDVVMPLTLETGGAKHTTNVRITAASR